MWAAVKFNWFRFPCTSFVSLFALATVDNSLLCVLIGISFSGYKWRELVCCTYVLLACDIALFLSTNENYAPFDFCFLNNNNNIDNNHKNKSPKFSRTVLHTHKWISYIIKRKYSLQNNNMMEAIRTCRAYLTFKASKRHMRQ